MNIQVLLSSALNLINLNQNINSSVELTHPCETHDFIYFLKEEKLHI